MSPLTPPKLVDLDDPLAPRPAPAPAPAASSPTPRTRAAARAPRKPRSTPPATPPSTPSPPRTLADEPLVAVFARLPESLSDRLADGVRALNEGRPRRGRVSQQDLLGALVDRYVTPKDTRELGALVDDYRQRVRS